MLITTLNASISHLLMSSRFYITIYCTQLQQHFTDNTERQHEKRPLGNLFDLTGTFVFYSE